MTALTPEQTKRMEELAYNYGEANSDYKTGTRLDLAFMHGFQAALSDPSSDANLLAEAIDLIKKFDPDDCFVFEDHSEELGDEVTAFLEKIKARKDQV